MPAFIRGGMLNVNTPQQNAGVFAGQYNIGGMDANMKITKGSASHFGFFNIVQGQVSIGVDNMETADGVIFDSDVKPQVSFNV